MLCHRLHIFPIIMALYLPITFIITYAMAVASDHVEPLFPYISDTGTIPPESCVFGQLLNIYAALTAWCMYLRYKQVRIYYRNVEKLGGELSVHRTRSVRRKHLANKICLIIGMVTALGVSVVGNFQEDNVMSVHFLGAVMAFGGAGVYCWIQSIISYKMANLPRSKAWCRHVRIVLSVVHAVCFFIMLIATKLSLDKFPYSLKQIKKWKSSDPGYTEHLFATFAEWLMAMVSSAYFLTFVAELKVVKTKVVMLALTPPVHHHNHSAIMPDGSTTDSTANVSAAGASADGLVANNNDRKAQPDDLGGSKVEVDMQF